MENKNINLSELFSDDEFIKDVIHECYDYGLRYTRLHMQSIGEKMVHTGLVCMNYIMLVNHQNKSCITDPNNPGSNPICFELSQNSRDRCAMIDSRKKIDVWSNDHTEYTEYDVYNGYPDLIHDIGSVYLADNNLSIQNMAYIMVTFYAILQVLLRKFEDENKFNRISMIIDLRDIA